MIPRRKKLLDQIAQARAQRPCRFGAELKLEIVAYAEWQQTRGVTKKAIASELALNAGTLGVWTRHVKRRRAAGLQPFEPVGRGESLVLAALPRDAEAAAGPTRPPVADGHQVEARRANAVTGYWLVVRAEHVYKTTTEPAGLTPLGGGSAE